METNSRKFLTQNTRIMVNFEERLIVHCNYHELSTEYKLLIAKGYVEVGKCYPSKNEFFWDSQYFNPPDKYVVT